MSNKEFARFAFNTAVVTNNALSATGRGIKAAAGAVSRTAVGTAVGASEGVTAFKAGWNYASSVNKETGTPAELLTKEDIATKKRKAKGSAAAALAAI